MKILIAALMLMAALPVLSQAPRLGTGDPGLDLYRAQSLMRSRPDLALEMLRELVEAHPGQDHLRFELARAHLRLDQFEEAESILRELLERSPGSAGIVSELILLMLRSGREEEGRRLAEEAFLTPPLRDRSFRDLARLYREADRYDLAEEAYLLGLRRLPDSDQRGRVRLMEGLITEYALNGRTKAMLEAYLDWPGEAAKDPATLSLMRRIERKLREMDELAAEVALADSLAVGVEGAKLAPLLREIYFAARDWDAYLREVERSFPKDFRERQSWLAGEARRCEDWPPAARSIWTRVLEDDPRSFEGRQARLALLRLDIEDDALDRLRGGEGIEGLAGELAALASVDFSAEVNLEISLARQDLLRRVLGDAPAAEAALREDLLRPYGWFPLLGKWRLEAELGLDLLAQERIDEARALYSDLLEASRPRVDVPAYLEDLPRMLQRAESHLASRYQLARIAILDGDAGAQDSLAAIAKEFPSSRQANDALEDALLLAESASWPKSLSELLTGSLELEILQRPLKAAERLVPFTEEFPGDAATAPLLYRSGLLYERGLRGREALEAWERLAADFPDHHRAVPALERAARLSLRMGEVARARELLERIIVEHPDATQVPGLRELRDRLEEEA